MEKIRFKQIEKPRVLPSGQRENDLLVRGRAGRDIAKEFEAPPIKGDNGPGEMDYYMIDPFTYHRKGRKGFSLMFP